MSDHYSAPPVEVAAPKNSPLQAAAAFGIYVVLLLSVVGSAALLQHAAFDPGTYFDFDNLLNINRLGATWLLGIAVLPVALFLLFQVFGQVVHRFGLPVTWRAGALLAAAFAAFGVGMALPGSAQMNLGVVVGFGLVVVALFDFLTDRTAPGFEWTVLAVMLFSAFAAVTLFEFSQSRDRELRAEYALALAFERDTAVAEPLLEKMRAQMQNDAQLPLLLKPWPFKPSADTVRNHLNRLAYADHYLFQHYRLSLFAFDRDEEAPLLIDQSEGRSALLRQWEQATPVGTELRSTNAPDGTHRYLLHLRVNRMNDASHPADIYCAFDHEYPRQTKAYSQLFNNQAFKNLERLSNYDYAVLRDRRLVVEQGHVGAAALNAAATPNQVTEVAGQSRIDALAGSTDGHTTAVVGRPATGWDKALYLFAMLFTVASVVLFALGGLLRVLPQTLTFLPTARGSLARRIHFSNLALLAAGFLILGGMAYWHFADSARKAEIKDADFRAEAVLNSLRLAGYDLPPGGDSLRLVLSPALARTAASLLIDANLYDANGRLAFTTRDDLRRLGLLPAKMDADAYTALSANNGATKTEINEKMNAKAFSTKYFSLQNRGGQALGFVGVPYLLGARAVGPEVSNFIGMLAGIYVFLLLIGVGATLVLARSITKPLNEISLKINALQLEDKNQPLEYTGDKTDELGALVGEYNRMVDKLEDSKLRLVKLEREAAWREMARQIAHDIKNPLTTMKLSMQQLERVSNDPTQAAAYLKRATGRLIEQIDSLAQTASEFSMFAQLDIKQKGDTVLNDIVESVYDLFTEQHEAKLKLELPNEPFHIRADKNHLLRVFNNLVINAIQAIPSDREGNVKVSLTRIGQKAVVRISDNGGGIPIEIRDRVFEPNFTTKTTGSGLGLAICKKIIEAHDGDIRFETRDNEGTDFFVELPIVEN